MSRFDNAKADLLERVAWDRPEFVVQRIAIVIVDLGIDKDCKACGAKAGQMCTDSTGRDRSVTHTERSTP